MARRPTFGAPVQVAAATTEQSNYEILGLIGQEDAYPFLASLNSVDVAINDLNAHAADTTKNLTATISHAFRLGSIWRLLERRGSQADNPWTIEIGPDKKIKVSDLIDITIPSGQRGAPPRTVNQRELVEWDAVPEGQTVPQMTERHGKLAFRHLRQNQRAMLVNYSVAHLGVCGRILDNAPIAERSVEWVQARIADDTLQGQPRKAEGLEYVADCIRIFKAYNRARNATDGTESDGLKAAQKALAPRGGGARRGVAVTDRVVRLLTLSAHLLSTVSKAGLQTPMTRMLPTLKELGRWSALPFSDAEEAAWQEVIGKPVDSPLAALAFPAASRLYAAPLPAENAGENDPLPIETMSDGEIDAANMVRERGVSGDNFPWFVVTGGGLRQNWWQALPDEDWQNILRYLERMEQRPSRPVNILWSQTRYQDERRARAAITRARLPAGHYEIISDNGGYRVQV